MGLQVMKMAAISLAPNASKDRRGNRLEVHKI